MTRRSIWMALLTLALIPATQCAGQMFPQQFRDIGIQQQLNGAIPLDVTFRDQTGALVPLRSYFTSKPVLLVPVYYTCPTLCNMVLSGVVEGLSRISLRSGRDYEVVVFSFNPAETPADARRKYDQCTRNYAGHLGAPGWHFLTGSPSSIQALTSAIGFRYRYDPQTKMFVHASGIMAITPQGRISRYFYGVTYQPKDLELGLMDASHGRIGSVADRLLLLCYQYDPATGRYGAAVMSLLRAAALLTLLVMILALTVLWRFDLRHYRRESAAGRIL